MQDIVLQGGYMHPLLYDKGKNFLTYLVGSALIGYEELNKGKRILPDGARLLDRSRFVYGVGFYLSFEVFITDSLLLLAKGEGRFLFGSDVHCFHPAFSVGLRFNL